MEYNFLEKQLEPMITALSGAAAANIRGTTIHEALNIDKHI